MIFIISFSDAYTIEKKEYTHSGVKYFVYCNGYKFVTKPTGVELYWDTYGNKHRNLHDAIKASCNSTSIAKTGNVRKGAILFKKRLGENGIEHCLKSESNWAICDYYAATGKYLTITKKSKGIILKKYSNKSLIDDYYKTRDKHHIYYIRSKDISLK